MKKIYVAYYPAKGGPEMILCKKKVIVNKILKLSPLLKFEEVEIQKEIFDSLPETVLQKL